MEAEEKQGRSSTAHSRELGAHLRLARKRSGEKVDDLLAVLGWSVGKLSKLEAGTRGTSPHEIATLLGACRVEKRTRDRIMALAEAADTGGFLRLHDGPADALLEVRVHEQQATAIAAYDPVGIPALAQTADYALALTGDAATVAARMRRQLDSARLVNRAVTFYITEPACSPVVGPAKIMRDQLLHLTRLGERTGTAVRIIPRACGFHGFPHHPATLLTLVAPHRPVVHVETDAATVFHDAPEVVSSYQRKVDRLDRTALSAADSRQFLVHCLDRPCPFREAPVT